MSRVPPCNDSNDQNLRLKVKLFPTPLTATTLASGSRRTNRTSDVVVFAFDADIDSVRLEEKVSLENSCTFLLQTENKDRDIQTRWKEVKL